MSFVRFALLLTVVLLVTPPPREAAVVPAGAFIMSPYQVPRTLTKTSRSLLAIRLLPVRLNTVRLVRAAPVLALPAEVLFETVALPVVASASTALCMDWLVLLVTFTSELISAVEIV